MYLYRHHRTGNPCTSRYLWPVVLRRLRSLPIGADILDAGCGNGSFARQLNDSGYHVCGADLSEDGLEQARSRAPDVRFELASVYDDFVATFQRRFHAVVSLEVIEHLYDPGAFVRNVRDSLLPNGVFILSTPYHGWFKNSVIALSNRHDRHFNPLANGGHIKFWSRRTLRQLLLREGFVVKGFSGAGRLPWLWNSMVFVAQKVEAPPP